MMCPMRGTKSLVAVPYARFGMRSRLVNLFGDSFLMKPSTANPTRTGGWESTPPE